MYKKDDTILVVTNRTGYIPQMRMCGPIIQPISIPVSLCLSMVCSGVELYEVDPITKTNVKLTPQNIMDDTKFAPVDIVMSENDKDEVKKEVESPVTNAEVLPPVASEAAIITSDNVVETSEETTEAKTTEQAQSKKNKNKNKNK